MIITSEPSRNSNKDAVENNGATSLQNELNELRQRKIAKSTVWSDKPSSTLSMMEWAEQQKALKEKDRESKHRSRKLMESYKAMGSDHFDYQQKELTAEATDADKDALKAIEEEKRQGSPPDDDETLEKPDKTLEEEEDQNDTDTTVLENEAQSEVEEEAEEIKTNISAENCPEEQKITREDESTGDTAPNSPTPSISCRKDVKISVFKKKRKSDEDRSVATTQEIVNYQEMGEDVLCGCIIL